MPDFLSFLNPETVISSLGLLGVTVFIFAESGLFFGFFLPGDSLLFTAGFLASKGILPLPELLIWSMLAAALGDSFGYAFGRRVGPAIFSKEDSLLFRRSYVEKTRKFFALHGQKTIILARFVPVIRTFAPILAGVGEMSYRRFLVYNIVGGFLWVLSLCLSGYFLGQILPGVDQYLLPIVLVIIVISILPGACHFYRERVRSS